MTARDFARLLIKLMGLFILAITLVQLAQAISYFPSYIEDGSLLKTSTLYGVPILLGVLIGWLLFKSDRIIADRMLFAADAQEQPSTLSFEKAEEMLISILGVYLIAHGLIGLARTLGWLISYASISSGYDTLWDAYFIPAAAEIAIGALVFLSSRGLVVLRQRFLDIRNRVREVGMDE